MRDGNSGQLTPSATYLDSFLGGARSVAVSPDGVEVYVAAGGRGFVDHNREQEQWSAHFKDKYSNNQFITGLTGAYGLAVCFAWRTHLRHRQYRQRHCHLQPLCYNLSAPKPM